MIKTKIYQPMKNIVLFCILIVFLNGCTETDEIYTGDNAKLIFQSEYTNYAWGYNHNGWMMDSSGKARSFQKTAPWVFPDSLGYISEADMLKNLAACDADLKQISATEFSKYAEKAATCVSGTLTKPENKMADAGANVWAFYYYDSTKKGYKRVILDMTGDWSQQNLAPTAKEVVEWMKTVK
jgi:hypothetical protein